MPSSFFLLMPIAGALLFALTSCADTGHETSHSFFRAADSNGDNRLSQPEFTQAQLRRIFDKLDVNRDHIITFDEWQRFDFSPEAPAHFAALDPNNDKSITLAEFLGLAPKHSDLDEVFHKLDTDKDGFLSNGELEKSSTVRVFSMPF